MVTREEVDRIHAPVGSLFVAYAMGIFIVAGLGVYVGYKMGQRQRVVVTETRYGVVTEYRPKYEVGDVITCEDMVIRVLSVGERDSGLGHSYGVATTKAGKAWPESNCYEVQLDGYVNGGTLLRDHSPPLQKQTGDPPPNIQDIKPPAVKQAEWRRRGLEVPMDLLERQYHAQVRAVRDTP